jgi:hypothetical protein
LAHSLISAVHLGGHRHHKVAGIDVLLPLPPSGRQGRQHNKSGRLDPRLPLGNVATIPHLYKNALIDIRLFLFEATKTFDIFGWRDERIIDTSSLFIPIPKTIFFGYGVPASEDGGCGLFFRHYTEMGVSSAVLHPHHQASFFCIGVSRRGFLGLLFSSSCDTIYLVFWACVFSTITEAATFHPSLQR